MKEEEKCDTAFAGFIEAQSLIQNALAQFPSSENGVHAESLAILRFAAENTLRLVNVLVLRITGADKEKIEKAEAERKQFFEAGELRFQPYVDGFYENLIVGGIVAAQSVGIYAQ